MARLTKEERVEVLDIIKELAKDGLSISDMQKEISKRFCKFICWKSVEYYYFKVFPKENGIYKDNLVMAKWRLEYSDDSVASASETHAEDLFRAFGGDLEANEKMLKSYCQN